MFLWLYSKYNSKKYYICDMGTIQDIKTIFTALTCIEQEQVLEELLQEHEIQGR